MEKISNLYSATCKRLKEEKRKRKKRKKIIVINNVRAISSRHLNNFDAIKKATTFDRCRFFNCSRLLLAGSSSKTFKTKTNILVFIGHDNSASCGVV